MQMAASGAMGPSGPGPQLPAKLEKKLSKMKTSEIIEMQELMCGKLVEFRESLVEAQKAGKGFKDQLLIPFCQAMSSASVEKKYFINAEEMAMSGEKK
jgi:hypothetical protein